jgi:hypothetical protein
VGTRKATFPRMLISKFDFQSVGKYIILPDIGSEGHSTDFRHYLANNIEKK